MAALSRHANVKVFSEKLLLLLNRGGEARSPPSLPHPVAPQPPLPGVALGPMRTP